MDTYIKNKLIGFWVFTKQLLLLIGFLTVLAFISLQLNQEITINPDIFKSTSEIAQVNRNLKDYEAIMTSNMSDKVGVQNDN